MDLSLGKRLVLSMWQDWTAVFSPARHNWIDVAFLQLTFEVDKMCGDVEAHAALAGVHVRIAWTYDLEIVAAIKRAADVSLAGRCALACIDEDWKARTESTNGPLPAPPKGRTRR